MVILVGIVNYDKEGVKPEIDGFLKDSNGVQIDIKNCVKLFQETFNYSVFPKYNIHVRDKPIAQR